ncbi:MAG TPA: ABC transporter ATP-binding protein [Vicinamibacterales bacterium]|nr:ABC transporter ATP-binding protein [Vicinamibacterales bacterium]
MDFDRVSFVDVSRSFGRRRALAKVSLECRAGEVLGLLGPNGAGKSTLLAIAATLMPATTGEVRYGAETARSGGAALRARIGVLAHDLHLYPELTARENLEFFGRLYALPDVRQRAVAALERAGLADRADDAVSGYSRGMRQRLAVERALLHEPRLVLFDEPFTGLDDDARQALLRRLRALREAGCIVMVATHDFGTVDEVLDRAALLRDGRLVSMEQRGRALRDVYRASRMA